MEQANLLVAMAPSGVVVPRGSPPRRARLQASARSAAASLAAGLRRVGWGAALPLLVLAVWQLSASRHWVNPLMLPAPAMVADALLRLADSGQLLQQWAVSLWRVVQGFAWGALAGLALGAAMGLSRRAEAYLRPSFQAISLVPVLGWLPLAMLVLGIDEALKVVLIAKAVWTPVTVHTFEGIRAIPAGLFEVAAVWRLSRVQTAWRLVVPGAWPALATGLRQGLANAWMSLVAVELLAASEGIGFLMVDARQLFRLDEVMATMVVIGLTGWGLDRALAMLEQRALKGRRRSTA